MGLGSKTYFYGEKTLNWLLSQMFCSSLGKGNHLQGVNSGLCRDQFVIIINDRIWLISK